MPPMEIRPGTGEDVSFLRSMLFEAAFWRPTGERPPLDVGLAHPDLAKILEDWGQRPGDTALIAVSQDGEPVGTAWYRFWRKDDHSYGFVDEQVPEIGISVVREARGQGVGGTLLAALIAQAREDGLRALSLSVETENPARKLYEKFGFRPQRAEFGSLIMVLDLGYDGAATSWNG